MENTDKAWDKIFRFVQLVKHTKYNTADSVKQTIQKRRFARQTKDWAKSDKLRADLDKAGVLIDDRQDSSYWYYK